MPKCFIFYYFFDYKNYISINNQCWKVKLKKFRMRKK